MNAGGFPGWPPPGPYDPSGPYHNPGSTHPPPHPKDAPVGCWFSAETPVQYSAGTSPVVRTATWQTPIFDLRPELKNAGLANTNRTTGVQPIWRSLGAGGQLFIFVDGLDAATNTLTEMEVFGIEFAHPSDPNQLDSITTEEDLTAAHFTAGKGAALISVFPPGSGYPVRYWRFRLRFDVYADRDPALRIAAAYY